MGLGQGSGSSARTFILLGKLRLNPGPVDKAVQWVKGKGKSLGLEESANYGGWGWKVSG